ncbi:MAG: NAD(+)/NADH kinase [Patescibacteria group bacterium]
MKVKFIPTKDERNLEVNNLIKTKFPHFLIEHSPELLLVVGGDGALLHAIQEYNNLQIPFFGIAGGTLNFMMNPIEDLESFLMDLITKNPILHTVETTSIKTALHKQKEERKFIGWAVNDVVLGTSIMGYHKFVINSTDGSFEDFAINGSGICLSTELGSTGYNFNLGGSILPMGSNLWSLNGIVCNRYLDDILKTQRITFTCESKREPSILFIDGMYKGHELNQGDQLIVEQGQIIKLAFLHTETFITKRIEIASRFRKH